MERDGLAIEKKRTRTHRRLEGASHERLEHTTRAAALSMTGGNDQGSAARCVLLALEDVQESDLPGAIGAEFAEMTLALHRAHALPGDDVVKASVRKLSNEEARRYAELVVRLYGMFAGMKQQIHNGRGNRTAARC